MKNIILILMLCGILSGCTKKEVDPEEQPQDPEQYISFQDYTVKQICINMWDTNGDGKLSTKEAAAVKSIGNVFTGKKIFCFDELKYFTGITVIPDNAFFYTEKSGYHYVGFLKSITIPKNVRRIGSSAISNDPDATITFMPRVPPEIDGYFTTGNGEFTIYVPSHSYKTAGGDWEFYYYDHIIVRYNLL